MVSVLMPAFNESQRIRASVSAALEIPQVDEVLVIDDGSSDNTADLAEGVGARVIRLKKNKGKGGALNEGLKEAQGDIILTLDADLGVSAWEGGKLLEPLLGGKADMVVAMFPQEGKSGFGLAKGLASHGIELFTGQKFREPLSGQRAIRKEILEKIGGFSSGFSAEVGLTIDVLRLGYTVMEVAVDMTHAKTGRDLAGFRHRGRQFLHICFALLSRVRRK